MKSVKRTKIVRNVLAALAIVFMSAVLCVTGCKNAAGGSSGSGSGTSSGPSLTLAESAIAGKTFENGRTKLSFGSDKRGTKSSTSARAIADGDFTWTATFSGTDVNVTMTNSGGSSNAVLTGDTLSVDGTNYTLSGSGASSGGSSTGSGSSSGGGTTPETKEVTITFKAENDKCYIAIITNMVLTSSSWGGSIQITGKAGEPIYNTSRTLIKPIVQPNVGYEFDKWDKEFPTVFPAEDTTYTALVKSTSSSGGGTESGSETGGGTMPEAKEVTITFKANGNGAIAYTINGTTQYTVLNGEYKITGKVGESIYNSSLTNISAFPNTGVVFDKWDKDFPIVFPAEDMTITASFKVATYLPSSADLNGHQYVDLGLSVLWATCNVGAATPEEAGTYYKWGKTDNNSSSYTINKYDFSDRKTQLELADDAAAVNWRGKWRMPTKAEMEELVQRCKWTYDSTKKGFYVEGPNGNRIFILKTDNNRTVISYFTSTLYVSNTSVEYAYRLELGDNSGVVNYHYRSSNYAIRPVLPKN